MVEWRLRRLRTTLRVTRGPSREAVAMTCILPRATFDVDIWRCPGKRLRCAFRPCGHSYSVAVRPTETSCQRQYWFRQWSRWCDGIVAVCLMAVTVKACIVRPLLRLRAGRPAGPGADSHSTAEGLLFRPCIGGTGAPCGILCGPARVARRPRVGEDDDDICVGRGCCGSSKVSACVCASTTQVIVC